MNICPICEMKMTTFICPSCGADLTVDYENYPTFCDVSGTKAPMSAAKKCWISSQRSDMLICEKCGSASFRYYKNDNLHTCLRCGWEHTETISKVTVLTQSIESAPAPANNTKTPKAESAKKQAAFLAFISGKCSTTDMRYLKKSVPAAWLLCTRPCVTD